MRDAFAFKKFSVTIIVLCSFILLCIIMLGVHFHNWLVSYGENIERSSMLTAIKTAASGIEPGLVKSLKGVAEEVGEENYQSILTVLHRIKSANEGIRFIYVIAERRGDFVFLVDAEPPDSDDYSPPGDIYSEIPDEYVKVFTTSNADVVGPVVDRWGTWITGLSPIIDPVSNEVIAIIGMDVDAGDWAENINAYSWFALIIIGLVGLVILLSAAGIIHLKVSISEIRRLNETLENKVSERTADLLESEQRFRNIVEYAKDVIYTINKNGILMFLSPSYYSTLGYESEEVVGENFADRMHPDDVPKVREAFENMLKKREPIDIENFRVMHADRSWRWFSSTGAPVLDENGDVQYFVGIAKDVTELKQAYDELIQAKAVAEKANKAKSVFLVNMTHEIRTPMNAIMGFSELLEGTDIDSQQKKFLESIRTSGASLLSLINDILDLSRIESDTLELEFSENNLHSTLSEVKNEFSKIAVEKGIEYTQEVDEELPGYIEIDPKRFRQILSNVVGNAVKFTDKGHVRVSVSGTNQDPERSVFDLSVSVEDTGIGIAGENVETIFGAYVQHHGEDEYKYGGTGLGLAITDRLLKKMNEEISVESTVGKGSVFTILFNEVKITDTPEDLFEQKEMDTETVTVEETEIQEELSPETIQRLPELLTVLQEKYLPRLEELKDTLTVNEIEEFAKEILDAGIEFQYPPVVRWSEKLLEQAGMFDMNAMSVTLEEYPEMIDKMKELLES